MTPDEHTNQEFFLDVGDGHQIYVQDWGNKDAKTPILFLHGGPGGGCNEGHKMYFDPTIHRVIFHDQRGSGKSLPYGSLENNTTSDVVEDIKKLVTHLKLNSFVLYGRSWGSCLALVYALKHPQKIKALVIGGVFTGYRQAHDFEQEHSLYRLLLPDAWERLLEHTPSEAHHEPLAYHERQVLKADEITAKQSAFAYSEMVRAALRLDDRLSKQDYETFNWQSIKVELHYKQHDCFLSKNFILEHAHSLQIPVWIIQGRYDILCPPKEAYELHQTLPDSHLLWATAGHAGSDRAVFDITRTLLLQLAGA